EPTIALADEPTASLDSEKAYEVIDLLADVVKDKNRSVVMVTHDIRMAKKCDVIYEISDGELKEKKLEDIEV
ncbi:MAG: ABC transporter ATP-binding protein, partial [Coprobacillaceae bacterium]